MKRPRRALETPIVDRSSTSARGGFGDRASRPFLIVPGGGLSFPGTSSADLTTFWQQPYEWPLEGTTSGPATERSDPASAPVGDPAREATREAVGELRRLSGLTWEQLARLFDVSRRSVHFWASGKPLSATHEEHLHRVLAIVREADRGSARETRAALLETTDGGIPFELLARRRFDEARALLGTGPGRRRVVRGELSTAAKIARRPLPPEELVGALHDRAHREVGRTRAARTKRRERD